MVKSLITAFCASKNVLCGDGDAFKYFAEPELNNRYHTCPSLLQRKQIRSKGEKRALNFTLRACAAIPHLSKLRNAPRRQIWYCQPWWQNSRPRGGLLHHMKHNSQSDSITWKIKPGDNSAEFGPQPRNPAQFYKQVLHGHMLTGSGSTMRLRAQIIHNTRTPTGAHDVHQTETPKT